MAKFTVTPVVKKQWDALLKKEHKYLEKQYESGMSYINDKIEEKIPQKLRDTLDAAFNKAFALVFDKGTDLIEKTYDKEKHETEFKKNEFAESVSGNMQNSRAFAKRAGGTKTKNLMLSGIEGLGLGVLGVGLPDIPLFTSMILKSLYEIALSYGYSYDDDEEKIFILKLISTAMSHGDQLYSNDKLIDGWIYNRTDFGITEKDQIRETSDALAMEMIYTKFIQTIPIAGAIGGAYDVIFLNKITKYADIKYQKRFLFGKFTVKKDD